MEQKLKRLTISQALRRRKKLKGDIATHTERLSNSLVHLKDAPPTFPFEETEAALTKAKFELINLEDALARANAYTKIFFKEAGVYLTWVLRTLAEIKGDIVRYERYEHMTLPNRDNVEKREVPDLSQVIEVNTPGGTRRSHPTKVEEIVRISNITEKERAEKVEQLKREFEELNDLLETANHSSVLEYQDQPTEGETGRGDPQSP